jgi:hypothetical protein
MLHIAIRDTAYQQRYAHRVNQNQQEGDHHDAVFHHTWTQGSGICSLGHG